MTAKDIIYKARSASDLPSSKFVSHQDELDSLNERFKDIYSTLVDADTDYFITETTFPITVANAVAGSNNEYTVALPTDFFKLRYLDYSGSGSDWLPVRKFNLSAKDNQPGVPFYRIKGSVLWIIGGSFPATGFSLKMGYYPIPATITAPDADLLYGTSYSAALFPLVTAPGYAPYLQTMVYAYNGTGIKSESVTNNTVAAPVALFTESGAVTNLVYYKGILYWIRGGNMWSKATDLQAAFVAPVQLGAIANVTSFYIYNDTVYYTNATQIRSCTLTGGSDALLATPATVPTSVVAAGPTLIYRNTASQVVSITPASTMYASGIAKVTSDSTGGNVLYILDNAGNLRKVTYNATTAAILTDDVIDTRVSDIGQAVLDFNKMISQSPSTIVPALHYFQQVLHGEDASVDYSFTFPNNAAFEIMAWGSAIDYRIKQGADIAGQLLKLGHPTNAAEGPATGLWARFEQTIKRDDYQPERIRNVYAPVEWNR